jgi:hypothetical protein
MSYLPNAEKLAALNAGHIAGNLYALDGYLLRVGETTVRLRPTAPAGQPLLPSTVKTCATEADFDAWVAALL